MFRRFIFILAATLLLPLLCGAAEAVPKAGGIKNLFKNKKLNFFPVPVFETSPEKRESYGAMPVLLLSDKETRAISIILAAIGQWNKIIKFSGAGVVFAYPHPNKNPDEVFELYFGWAQRFYRETTVRYFNPRLGQRFYLNTQFIWLKTPFPRFFGYGAESPQAGESNYVAQNFHFETTFGYYLLDALRVNLTQSFLSTDLMGRGITDVADTLTLYGALPGVTDSTNLIQGVSLTYDTRPDGMKSKRGVFAEGRYFFSIDGFLSDHSFHGFSLEAIQLIPLLKERTVTSLRFIIQDMYGTAIPFYLRSRLGGESELRAFITNRFTDNGKIYFAVEQRIRLFSVDLFGIPVAFHADPFFELGRVFRHVNSLDFRDLQPVGGLGLRGIVPPNVVGRVDIAVGREGYAVYTTLGYPF